MEEFRDLYFKLKELFFENNFKVKSYLYLIYMFLWLIFNGYLSTSFAKDVILSLFSGHPLSFGSLIIFDILVSLVFYTIGTYTFSPMFLILNVAGMFVLMSLVSFYSLIRIIIIAVMLIIFIFEVGKIVHFNSVFEDDEDEKGENE